MGMTAVYAIGAAVSAGAAADNANNQRTQAREAANSQRLAASATAEANRMAAEQASRQDQLSEEARRAEARAAEQMGEAPEVTILQPEATQRRRRVQAAFEVGAGGASSAGSIRL